MQSVNFQVTIGQRYLPQQPHLNRDEFENKIAQFQYVVQIPLQRIAASQSRQALNAYLNPNQTNQIFIKNGQVFVGTESQAYSLLEMAHKAKNQEERAIEDASNHICQAANHYFNNEEIRSTGRPRPMSDALATAERELSQLTQQTQNDADKIGQLQNELDRLNAMGRQNEDLRSTLDKLTDSLTQKENEIACLNAKFVHFQERNETLSETNTRITEIAQESPALEEIHSQLRIQLAETAEINTNLTHLLRASKSENAEQLQTTQQTITALESALANKQAELDASSRELDAQAGTIKALQSENTSLNQSNTTAFSRLAEQQEIVRMQETELATLQGKLTETTTEATLLKNEIQFITLYRELEKATSEEFLNLKTEQIASLKIDLAAHIEQGASNERIIASLKENAEQLQTTQQTITALQSELANKEAELDASSRELHAQAGTIKALQSENTSLNQSKTTAFSSLAEQQEIVKKQETELATLKEKLRETTTEATLLKNQIELINLRLEQEKAITQEYVTLLKFKTEEIASLTSNLAAHIEEGASNERIIASLKEDAVQLKNEIKSIKMLRNEEKTNAKDLLEADAQDRKSNESTIFHQQEIITAKEAELNTIQEELKKSNSTVAKLENKLTSIETKVMEAQKLSQEIVHIKGALEKVVSAEIELSEVELNKKNQQIETLTTELFTLKNTLATKEIAQNTFELKLSAITQLEASQKAIELTRRLIQQNPTTLSYVTILNEIKELDPQLGEAFETFGQAQGDSIQNPFHIEALEASIAKKEKFLEELQQTIANLEEKVSLGETRESRYKQKLLTVLESLGAQSNPSDDLNSMIEEIVTSFIAQQKKSIQKLAAQHTHQFNLLRIEFTKQKDDAEEKARLIDTLERTLAEIKVKEQEAKDALSKAEIAFIKNTFSDRETINSLKAEIDKHKEAYTHLNTLLAKKEAELNAENEELAQENAKLQEALRNKSELEERLEETVNLINQQKEQIQQQKEQIESILEKNSVLERWGDEFEPLFTAMNEEITRLTALNRDLTEKNDPLAAANFELSKPFQSATIKADSAIQSVFRNHDNVNFDLVATI